MQALALWPLLLSLVSLFVYLLVYVRKSRICHLKYFSIVGLLEIIEIQV